MDIERRKAAFEAVKGLWADRTDIGDTDEYVRKLRRGTRLERFRRWACFWTPTLSSKSCDGGIRRYRAGGTSLQPARRRVFYSPVTAAELWRGMRPREERQTTELLASLSCLLVTDEIGRLAGRYLQRFRPSHGVELADALIGATASVHGCELWTRNLKHYPTKDISFF